MTILCKCGCGRDAPISTRNDTKRGYIKGQARDFIWHHHVRITNPVQTCEACGGSLQLLHPRQLWISYQGKRFLIPDLARRSDGHVCLPCARRIKDSAPSRKGKWTKELREKVNAIVSAKQKGIPKPQPNSLSADDIKKANELYATGRYTQRQIGHLFGVDASVICRRLDHSIKSMFPKRRTRVSLGYPGYEGRPWCIYALVDPRTKEPRYVGWTLDSACRLQHHIAEAKTYRKLKDTHKSRWIAALLRDSLKPELIVLEQGEGKGWQGAERQWIAKLRAEGHALTNIADGGQGNWGHKLSPEARKKIGDSKRNIPLSTDRRKALVDAGRKWFESADNRLIHSQRMKGRIVSEATRRKISETKRIRFAQNPYVRRPSGGKSAT